MTTRGSRPLAFALGGLLGLGVLLRLFEYFENRPLWIDEAMLAINIGQRGYVGLVASPLDYDQVAAPLFLWGVESITRLAGMHELALRLLPFLAGVLLPWVVWRCGVLLGGSLAGLIAATAAAVSVPLIYQSAELKPYSLDALVTATMIMLTLELRADPQRVARWRRLVVAGAVGLLLSIPLPFMLAGVAAALLADPGLRRTKPLGRVLAAGLVWGGVFVALYLSFYRPTTSVYLDRFWQGTLLDPAAADFPARVYGLASAWFHPLPVTYEVLSLRWVVLLAGLGTVLLIRRAGVAAACLLGIPVLAVAVASVFGLYPIAPRLLLFLAPCAFFLVGVALAETLRLLRLPEAPAAVAGTVLVLLWGGPAAWRNLQAPDVRSEGRDLVRRVLASAPADPVYITATGLPSWIYYSTDWRAPDEARVDFMIRAGAADGPAGVNGLLEVRPGRAADTSLLYPGRRPELLGRRSGMTFAEPDGLDLQMTPGWAAQEVDRMMAAARPDLWIYGAHWIEWELPVLQAEFTRRGITVVESLQEIGAAAMRLRVPADTAAAGYRPPAGTRP